MCSSYRFGDKDYSVCSNRQLHNYCSLDLCLSPKRWVMWWLQVLDIDNW